MKEMEEEEEREAVVEGIYIYDGSLDMEKQSSRARTDGGQHRRN